MRAAILVRAIAVTSLLALVILGPAGAPAEAQRLTVGLAGHTKSYLSLYLARERTAREEGLDLELAVFEGGSRATAALVSGSVDLALASLDTLVSTLAAGRAVKVFYGGFNHADLEWFAAADVTGWDGLRGRTLAVSAPGSLTDNLTRYVLRRRGLQRDVHVVALGGPSVRWQALRAGRVDAAVLQPPHKWQAEAQGFKRLGTQLEEIGPEWPMNVMFAREEVLERQAPALRALLRAHVRALRLVRSERELGVGALMRWLKYERPQAERAVDDALRGFDERGCLPRAILPVFWQIAVAAGDITQAWPESRYFDHRFVDTFDTWAPR
jgi:NitT/TauT family transport system substrate-binding protein